MKTRRKIIHILVALAFLMTLLVPMVGPASAATNYTTTENIPTFDPGTDSARRVYAAAIEVNIKPYSTGGTAVLEVVDSSGKSLPILSINEFTVGAKVYRYTFRYDNQDGREAWQILKISFDGSNANAGEVKAKFSKTTGQLVAGEITIAKAKGGAIEVTVPTVVSISDAGCTAGGPNPITIRVNETVNGGFEKGEDAVKFKLPSGFSWRNDVVFEILNRNDVDGTRIGYELKDENRTLSVVNRTYNYNGTILLQIRAGVAVDSSVAKYGDVKVKISGESTVTPSEVVVANYGGYEVKVTSVSVEKVMSGQREQEIGKFAIEESLPGSLVENRTIILTLPEQARWDGEYPELSTGESKNIGSLNISDFEPVGSDNRTIKATVRAASTGEEPTKIVFRNGKITVRGDYTGEIKLSVSGSAGASGTVVVAEAKAPVTATTESKPEVIIGMGSQAAGNVVITETEAEALQATYDPDNDAAYLVLEAPPGVRFAEVPTFTVTAGDLDLEDPISEEDWNVVAVRVRSTSSSPATVKVSNIKLIVDRTVPEGDIKLKIGGTSLVENNKEGYFPNVNWVTRVPVAKVITPAPEQTKVTVVFVVGETKYKVNGVEKAMDVAPYIKNNRTYMPIRFAAYAAGVADSNIIWNGEEQSVILIKGDRVVKMTVGSNTMLINGVPFAMDVAPELVDPGRVMLPIRWVAQALGCNVQWNEASQSVTIN